MSGKEARLAHLEARADEFDELIGRHAARFASFFELFDEMRGASRSAHGRIDNLIERLAEVETKVDDLDGPEFTDGSPDLPAAEARRPLYLVVSSVTGSLMDDPVAAITAPNERTQMHPATEAILRYFEYAHLPEHLQAVSAPFSAIANDVVQRGEGPEVTVCLRKLLEAKDCAVRAALG